MEQSIPLDIQPTLNTFIELPLKVHTKAIEAEAVKGSEQVSFRLPAKIRALVNLVLRDEGMAEYQNQATKFYTHAITEFLVAVEPLMQGNGDYVLGVRAIREASQFLFDSDLLEQFTELLTKAESRMELLNRLNDGETGLGLLDVLILAALNVPAPAGSACEELLRGSDMVRETLGMVLAHPVQGHTNKVHRVQAWLSL